MASHKQSKLVQLAEQNKQIKFQLASAGRDLSSRYGNFLNHPIALGFALGLALRPIKFITLRKLRTFGITMALQKFQALSQGAGKDLETASSPEPTDHLS